MPVHVCRCCGVARGNKEEIRGIKLNHQDIAAAREISEAALAYGQTA